MSDEEVEHGRVELLGLLELDAVGGAVEHREAGARNQLGELARLPERHEHVVLRADHVHRHRQRADPVARLVAGACVELADEALDFLEVRVLEHHVADELDLLGALEEAL